MCGHLLENDTDIAAIEVVPLYAEVDVRDEVDARAGTPQILAQGLRTVFV